MTPKQMVKRDEKEERALLALWEFESGHTYAEIGRAFGVSSTTAKDLVRAGARYRRAEQCQRLGRFE